MSLGTRFGARRHGVSCARRRCGSCGARGLCGDARQSGASEEKRRTPESRRLGLMEQGAHMSAEGWKVMEGNLGFPPFVFGCSRSEETFGCLRSFTDP